MERWISVNDESPGDGRFVAYSDGYIQVCYLDINGEIRTTWSNNLFENVTHWMPLPEPPKEDFKNERPDKP